MVSDAEEILNELEEIVKTESYGAYMYTPIIEEYIKNKRLEFVEPQGDCV